MTALMIAGLSVVMLGTAFLSGIFGMAGKAPQFVQA